MFCEAIEYLAAELKVFDTASEAESGLESVDGFLSLLCLSSAARTENRAGPDRWGRLADTAFERVAKRPEAEWQHNS